MNPMRLGTARPGEGRGGAARGRASAAWGLAAAAAVVLCAVGSALLPNGLPLGIVAQGLILGGLSSLTAMGLVIVYRSARIINFAQAEIGALAAAVTVIMVAGSHLPYLVAVPVGLAVALATGALVDVLLIRRLFEAPRLIVTVMTIGLAQVLGAGELVLPHFVSHLRPLTTFATPFTLHFTVGPVVFTGDYLVAAVTIPLCLVGLAWFFGRTDAGIAIRGAADSADRATLLGIPVRRLSTFTWMIAAGLSGVASILSGPILGPQIGQIAGPEALLAPLAAAVIGRMESLTVAFVAALAIGVFEQAVFWSYPRSSTVDVVLFGVILLTLVSQRRRVTRTDDPGLGGFVALRETRAIPAVLRRLPEVRVARWMVAIGVAAVAVAVPLAASDSSRTTFAYVAIYGILATSLVVLTGWSGQISLGQFAFAGVGAGTTAALFVHLHADLFASLAAAAVVGAATAVLIGIPAMRLPGLLLAVTTLAFAVPVSDFLLNSAYFPKLAPQVLLRPAVLRRFDLNAAGSFYFFCLLFLVLAVVLAWNYRRSRPGRTAVAVRDNARGAAAFGISAVRSKLTAFALAGALAGVAGGLYAVGLRGIGFNGYNPELSLQVFAMAVIGGLGSLGGAVLGAAYFGGVVRYIHGAAGQLLATGGGIVVVVEFLPSGLMSVAYAARDAGLRAVARRRGLSVPTVAEAAAFASEERAGGPDTSREATGDVPLLSVAGVDAGYGQVQVLFGVDLVVDDGEIVGLLGTNGAGKSTLLRVLSGLLPARRGAVRYAGRDLTGMSPAERVKAGLVMVPSGHGVFPSLTVADNLRLAAWLSRRDRVFVSETTAGVLELFPSLELRLSTQAANLSGGEQQMLTIAQALLCRPRLLLIDELSLGLAPVVVAQLLDVVRGLAARGVTVVVVEQSLNVATSVASRSAFMERGQVRFTGATADLARRQDLARSVFLGDTPAAPRRRTGRTGDGAAARRSATGGEPAPASPQPAFAARDVSCRFGGVSALDSVSIEAARGEILGVIGANGAGKTTLFDVCSGFLAASAGRIELGGVDITSLPAHARADLGLGRVFQDAALFPSLTVAETIAVALERHVEVRDPFLSVLRTGAVGSSESQVWATVDALIERFGLHRYRDAFVSELSTGTRRVVELACTLGHDPAVLLLDEPTSGIAQRESEALGRLLLDLRAETGGTFIVIEHDIPLVSSIADRLVCLHLGAVIAAGPPDAVLSDPAVIAAYLGEDQAAIARSGPAPRRRRTPRTAAPANGADVPGAQAAAAGRRRGGATT